jgi:anti-sigma regulatory factor (Ser/Thr protein kinase)
MESVIDSGVSDSWTSVRVDVDEQSQIGAARRCAVALGRAHNLGTEAVGRLAIVVTEAATNILVHAGRGCIILRALVVGTAPGVEVLALDKGPGMFDIERAMRDGYSTTGTAGQGLGGIRRLAELFEIHSRRGMGTALLARVGERTSRPTGMHPVANADDDLGVVCVPLRGEIECGDAWRVMVGRKTIAVLVVDGLGHGPEAAAAAAAATAAFAPVGSGPPETTLTVLDAAMRDTRGAALSVVVIDTARRQAQFGGMGNVDGRVLASNATEHLVPQNGIAGHCMPTPRSSSLSWPAGARLIMHSDGIVPRWRVDAYEDQTPLHPALLAGLIYRDFGRDRDDATVLVLRDTVAKEGR